MERVNTATVEVLNLRNDFCVNTADISYVRTVALADGAGRLEIEEPRPLLVTYDTERELIDVWPHPVGVETRVLVHAKAATETGAAVTLTDDEREAIEDALVDAIRRGEEAARS
ncbi:MAG: hypothetical protein GY926_19415 [bacterium]|nr:hypothetical protein [bacterium]